MKSFLPINCESTHMSSKILSDQRKVTSLKEITRIKSSRFVSHRARMPGEFDSKKDSQSTKFERRPQIFVKPRFRELLNSTLSSLHVFDNTTTIH